MAKLFKEFDEIKSTIKKEFDEIKSAIKNAKKIILPSNKPNPKQHKKKCEHNYVRFTETIPATHNRVFDGMVYYCHNEYDFLRTGVFVECLLCHTIRKITYENIDKQPKWVKERIDKMIEDEKWFF